MIGCNHPCDTFTNLNQLRIKSINSLIIGHFNTNFISEKFDQLNSLLLKKILIDVLILLWKQKLMQGFLILNLGNAGYALDIYSQKCDNFLLCCDFKFNSEHTEPSLPACRSPWPCRPPQLAEPLSLPPSDSFLQSII